MSLDEELLKVIEQLKLNISNITNNNYIAYINNVQTDIPLVKKTGFLTMKKPTSKLPPIRS